MSCQTESTFALENTHGAERAKPARPVASPRQHFEITQGKKRGEQLGAFQHLLGALLTDLGPWSVRLPDGAGGTAFIIGESAGNSGIFNYPVQQRL